MAHADNEQENKCIIESQKKATEFLLKFLNDAELASGYPTFGIKSHFNRGDDDGLTSVWTLNTDTYDECNARRIFDNKRSITAYFFDPALDYNNNKFVYDDSKNELKGGIIFFKSTWEMLNMHMFEGFKSDTPLPDIFKEDLDKIISNLPSVSEKYHNNYGMTLASYMYMPQYKLKYTKEFSHQPNKRLKRGFRLDIPFIESDYSKQADILKAFNKKLDDFNYEVRHSEKFYELEKQYPPNWSVIANKD